jgi:hypothetical protein
MKTIGGFFELEQLTIGSEPHTRAHALSTGRACMMVMLRHLRPRRVHVPYYTCNAALDPFRELAIPTTFYALDERLCPSDVRDVGVGEFIMWINYFGVCTLQLEELKRTFAERLLIDDTHAFFHESHADFWSFTSARKYFGVPDGAYLYAPVDITIDAGRFASASLTHSALRTLGMQDEAFAAYQAYERSLDCSVHRISTISEAILRGVDLAKVAAARRENFDYLHSRLGRRNRFPLPSALLDVPFCYPYLPAQPVDRRSLHARGVFVPTLWPDTATRQDTGFEWERRISAQLLPLPIDHRYRPEDLEYVADQLEDSR